MTIHETITLPCEYEGRDSRESCGRKCHGSIHCASQHQHFRKKLAEKGDETKRQTLLRLLAEEEAKLAALDRPPKEKQSHD